jgi:hypothetical protein
MVNSMTRFLAVDSAKVDLKERKDKLNNSKTEYLSLDDIRGYKVYTALLTQTGTDAPVVTVLENTLGGEVVWTRTAQGTYFGTLSETFLDDKTLVLVTTSGASNDYMVRAGQNSIDDIVVQTNDIDGILSDEGLFKTSIEIRIYN